MQENLHQRLGGILLLLMIILSVANGFTGNGYLLAGTTGWLAGLLLFRNVSLLQRWQSLVMVSIGSIGMVWGWLKSGQFDFSQVIASNQALLAMLASVGFLRLIALPETDKTEQSTPTGKKAIWRTLLGTHLFGAVINLSTIMIIADRQSMKRPLSLLQATVLSRGFALAALWSPFFAAMGVALTNADGSKLLTMTLAGIPIAALMLGIAAWQLNQSPLSEDFRGYPMHFEALLTPAILAVAVLILHKFLPDIPIITLIALLSVTLTLTVLSLREPHHVVQKSTSFVVNGLHRMSGELILFLAAGVLATGVTSVMFAYQLETGLSSFGAPQASLFLVVITLLAVIGVHPIIGIATSSPLLLPIVDDPNLLGMLYLMCWSTGVMASPLSGIHLAMQGRYGVAAHKIAHANTSFLVVMLLVEISALFIFEWLTASIT